MEAEGLGFGVSQCTCGEKQATPSGIDMKDEDQQLWVSQVRKHAVQGLGFRVIG